MMKRKAELKHRVQDVCESMEINMARLEQVATDIQNCDSALIVPKVSVWNVCRKVTVFTVFCFGITG